MRWKTYRDSGLQVSDTGLVIGVHGRFRKQFWLKNGRDRGYLAVSCTVDGVKKRVKVHRMVAELYVDNPDNLPVVRHLDGSRSNNHYTNLAWGTQRDNHNDAVAHGTKSTRKHANWTGKLTEAQVIDILARAKAGESPTALAREHGVKYSTIWCITSGKTWTYLQR